MTAAIVSVGAVAEDLFPGIETALRESFGCGSTRLAPIPEPANALDVQRGQHSSVLILQELVRRYPAGAERLLGLTEFDLFIPMLSFVFGQAQLGGKVALVSLARLRQEFYGLTPDADVLRSRVGKEVVHEVGHTFGLVHCLDATCPMALSTTISHIDRKGSKPCAACSLLMSRGTGLKGISALR